MVLEQSSLSNVYSVGRTTNTFFCNFLEIVTQELVMKERDKKRLKKFGVHLAKLMEEKGLSQRELASLCDVDHGKISKIINSKANLTLTTLIELADGLEMHPSQLLDIAFD